MKNVKARFEEVEINNPALAAYPCLALAVRGQNLSRPIIAKWFHRLVPREDYEPRGKEDLISQLVELSKST